MFFMILESLVGASLVLFGWVEANDSMARVYIMGVHLTNTLLLLGSIFLTAYWASGGKAFSFKRQGLFGWLAGLGILAGIFLVVTGAIIALGDSLFLQVGLTPEQSPVLAGILALRLTHPFTSVVVGLYWVIVARIAMLTRSVSVVKKAAWTLIVIILISWLAGFVNNWLKAPVVMQVIHLLVADLFWLGIIWLSAVSLAEGVAPAGKINWSEVFGWG